MYNNFEELNAAYPNLNTEEGLSFDDMLAYVQDSFDLYEKFGFKDKFDTPYEDYQKYNGQSFEVVRRMSYVNDNIHLECLPKWIIRFEDGVEIEAWPEEICKTAKATEQPKKKIYDVFFVLRGYAPIEASSEEEALKKAEALGYNDISWNETFETENVQLGE